jgi:hypothetical protein
MRSTNLHLAWIWVLAATVVLFVFGCAAPAPLVGLVPRTPDSVTWIDGRAALEREQDGVRVATAFEAQRGELLGLRLEIQNGTGTSFVVGPNDVTYMPCAGNATASCVGSFDIVDPEEMLTSIDTTNSREKAQAANAEVFDSTMVLLSVVGDVGNAAHGRPTYASGEAADILHGDEARHQNAQLTFANERQLWSDVAFRRNTLLPGRGASGLIYVPVDLKAGYIWIHVRAGGHIFPFGFRQVVTEVATPGSRSSSSQSRD